MSKESNKKQVKGMPVGIPGGMRALANSILDNTPIETSNEIVSKTKENTIETIPSSHVENSSGNGLIDFRNFLDEYSQVDPNDKFTFYVTSEIKDVLDKLKTSRILKKYTRKDILNAIIHAYIMEHKADIVEIMSTNKNNFLD